MARPEWARPVWATCEALAVLLAPHGEVALHDLGSGRIAGLWNPLSGRAVGEESLIARPQDLTAAPMVPYPATLPDGRQVSCVSAVVPDAAGVPRGLLCVNVDRSPLDRIAALAGGWLAPTREQPAELFQQDWRELIGRRVGAFCAARGLPAVGLDAADRRRLIAALDAEGLFAVRRAADLVAGALGVSRATVYAQLKETRR